MPDLNIVVVGSGNVAHHLTYRFLKAGHNILYVVSRSKESADIIQSNLEITVKEKIENPISCDLVVLAVTDNSINQLDLSGTKALVVHTSGSIGMDEIQADRRGVFYPLQSLKRQKFMDTSIRIPVFVNANSSKDIELLRGLAVSIRSSVKVLSDEERGEVHLAAVFANNFTNHMWHIAEEICKKEGVEFRYLEQLIKNSVHQLNDNPPSKLQTGPALRHDTSTMRKHMEMLSENKNWKLIYDKISESIRDLGNQ